MRLSLSLLLFLGACSEEVDKTPVPAETFSDSTPPQDSPADSPADSPDPEVDGDGDGFIEGDCDDDDPAVHPDVADPCDGVDNDCDGVVDEDAPLSDWYVDADGDGHGDPGSLVSACSAPAGAVALGDDCDDSQGGTSPDALEDWTDGVDNNCSGAAEFSGPVSVTGDATLDEHQEETTEVSKVRVLGLYEPGAGVVTVRVALEQPTVLVLNSYDPVNWEVTEDTVGAIQAIFVASSGGPGSTVSAPSGVVVTVGSYVGSAYDWDDSDTRLLVESAEAMTGLPVSSFHGAYQASRFVIEEGTSWPSNAEYPDCAAAVPTGPSAGPDPTAVSAVAACAGVVAESEMCLTTSGTNVLAVGLDSGNSCPVVASSLSSYSLAWLDGYLYACSGDYGILTRVDLATGAIEKAYVYCEGVVPYEGELLLFTSYEEPNLVASSSYFFEDFYQAQCGSGSNVGVDPYDMRFGAGGAFLYSAWHSDDHVTVYDLPSITQSSILYLEGYDDWIYGLDATDGGQMVINSSRSGTYSVFDLETGALDGVLPSAAGTTAGLECVTN